MDIYEYAMKMEKDGENYYREIASRTSNAGLKNIFTMLADAEVKHYNIFRQMKNNEKTQTTDAEFLKGVKNVFERMRDEKMLTGIDESETDLYRKAQEIEKKSENFYLEKADEVQDPHQSEILKKIAQEEEKHYKILGNILEFVLQPEQWLEDSEWYHLEDY